MAALQHWCTVLVASMISLAAASVVNVSVYYESLCPDSKQFVQNQLLPSYLKLGDYMDVKLISYGNANYKKKDDTYTFTCQHGPDECYGNMVQTCYIHFVNSTESQLRFLDCAFNYEGSLQRETIEKCIESVPLRDRVQSCVQGLLGADLEYEMALKTESLKPRHSFIPWCTIDGVGSREITDKALEDLESVVCDAMTGDKPEECSRKKKNLLMKFRNYYL